MKWLPVLLQWRSQPKDKTDDGQFMQFEGEMKRASTSHSNDAE
jgi:hypothetical protein